MKHPFTIDQLANASISEMTKQAFADAKIKLQRIITREGDANGKRLEPEYFDELVIEELMAMMSTKKLWANLQKKKESSKQACKPLLLSIPRNET